MPGLRPLGLGLLAFLVFAAAARADMAGPWPWSKPSPRPLRYGGTVPEPQPPDPPQVDPDTGAVVSPTPAQAAPQFRQPRRTGPFRSCGSGIGTGLAGIGIAWGLMWVGNRFAGRLAKK